MFVFPQRAAKYSFVFILRENLGHKVATCNITLCEQVVTCNCFTSCTFVLHGGLRVQMQPLNSFPCAHCWEHTFYGGVLLVLLLAFPQQVVAFTFGAS